MFNMHGIMLCILSVEIVGIPKTQKLTTSRAETAVHLPLLNSSMSHIFSIHEVVKVESE